LYQKLSNGASDDELLLETKLVAAAPMSWSPDGRFLVYWLAEPKTANDLWVLPLTGDRKPVPFAQSPFTESYGQISPDGRWIAYQSNDTGRPEVYVRPFPSGPGRWQISASGGFYPRWRRDGRELLYMGGASRGKLMAVAVDGAGSTFKAGIPQPLFDTAYMNQNNGGVTYHPYAVSADGQHFLIPQPPTDSVDAAVASITVVLNWTSALKK
jgi:dipeptidyl aminopeptidase/acylaminoacyl peptidase